MAKRTFLMFQISATSADLIFNVSNIILIAGAVLVAVGTFTAIWSGGIRERFADERISKNEVDTARANADAAIAIQNAATANLKAAETEKKSQEIKERLGNRRITENQHSIIVGIMKDNPASFNMEVMSDPESGLYAADILKTFTDSGWSVDKKEFPLGIIWTGIILFQTNDPSISIVEQALMAAGIPYSIGDQLRPKATIMIGGRPPFF